MFDKAKYTLRRVELGLSNESIALEIGINPVTLYRKISGETEFTRAEIQNLRRTLKLDATMADAIFFANELAETQEKGAC